MKHNSVCRAPNCVVRVKNSETAVFLLCDNHAIEFGTILFMILQMCPPRELMLSKIQSTKKLTEIAKLALMNHLKHGRQL